MVTAGTSRFVSRTPAKGCECAAWALTTQDIAGDGGSGNRVLVYFRNYWKVHAAIAEIGSKGGFPFFCFGMSGVFGIYDGGSCLNRDFQRIGYRYRGSVKEG